MGRWIVLTVCALVFAVTPQGAANQTATDNDARRRYDNGRKLMEEGLYAEAVRDLDEVAASYKDSPWAGEALALKAEYLLAIARDIPAARRDLDRLKQYRAVAATSYLFTGRALMAGDRDAKSLESAVQEFHRGHDFYRDSAYAAESRYREGDAMRHAGRLDDAIEEFQGLALSDPTSVWTARALLQLATCLTIRGRWQEGLSALQRLRADFEGVPAAAREMQTAIELNTIVYRLYIRKPPEQTPFRYAAAPPIAPNVRFEDVSAMTMLPTGSLVIAHKPGLVVVDRDREVLPSVRAENPVAIAARRRNESHVLSAREDESPAFIAQRVLVAGAVPGVALRIPDPPDKKKAVDDPSGLIQNWKREWLVADRGAKAIWVFDEKGEYLRAFLSATANIAPDRLAANAFDEVAVLDGDRKMVTILDREGRAVRAIDPQAHRFDRPVDLAFDPLGHLYVLDRGRGEVVVFPAQWVGQPRPIAVFTTPPERDPGAFRRAVALAIGARGQLFMFDEGARRIQVYQ